MKSKLMIGLILALSTSLSMANTTSVHNEKPTISSSNMNRLGDLNIVLDQPEEVFARNLTPEYLSQVVSTIVDTLSDNLPPQKINVGVAVEVKFFPNKQEINLLYKGKIDESLKPSFTIIKNKLHNISLKPTKEPLSFTIFFEKIK